MANDSSYDVIVVGAGSAGAVVASRLSEDPSTTVLLIEAGGRPDKLTDRLNVTIPAAFAKQFRTDIDWAYETEPEPHLGGRRILHSRGKMLGGSSSMNAMVYMRGNRHDYDAWAAGGATGWSYDDVLPHFIASERNSRGASRYHGADGPLHVVDPQSPNPLSQTVVDAMVAVGFDRNDDFNGDTQLGAGLFQLTQYRGRRWSTADAYLKPAAARPNLTVLTHATAHRLELDGLQVTGVVVEQAGVTRTIWANREVVLSGGAFGTPQLLMLSGIGPADHLAEHGIPVVVDNPHVGSHLMDHPAYVVNVETTAKRTLADAEKPAELVRFFAGHKGLLTSNVAEFGGFARTRSDDPAPDIQVIGAPAYFWDNGFGKHDKPAFAIGCSLVGALSEGSLRLRSTDPSARPAITMNYFDRPEDMDSMVAGIERIREIAAAGPLRGITGTELHPGSAVQSRASIEQAIREGVQHTYHPACSARIGSESDGVVGADLRVHGVTGLRVADASVFPVITRGNTNAPAILVGERAADFIRNGTGGQATSTHTPTAQEQA